MAKKRPGLSGINTPLKKRMTSIPKKKGINYLDLFVASKEKNRMEQEQEATEEKRKHLEESIERLDKILEGAPLEGEGDNKPEKNGVAQGKNKPEKDFKKIDINY